MTEKQNHEDNDKSSKFTVKCFDLISYNLSDEKKLPIPLWTLEEECSFFSEEDKDILSIHPIYTEEEDFWNSRKPKCKKSTVYDSKIKMKEESDIDVKIKTIEKNFCNQDSSSCSKESSANLQKTSVTYSHKQNKTKSLKTAENIIRNKNNLIVESRIPTPTVTGNLLNNEDTSYVVVAMDKNLMRQTSTSLPQQENEKPSKKKCLFPARRTKAKPLPILDDDELPNKRINPTSSTKHFEKGVTTLSCSQGVQEKQSFSSKHYFSTSNNHNIHGSTSNINREDSFTKENLKLKELISGTELNIKTELNVTAQNYGRYNCSLKPSSGKSSILFSPAAQADNKLTNFEKSNVSQLFKDSSVTKEDSLGNAKSKLEECVSDCKSKLEDVDSFTESSHDRTSSCLQEMDFSTNLDCHSDNEEIKPKFKYFSCSEDKILVLDEPVVFHPIITEPSYDPMNILILLEIANVSNDLFGCLGSTFSALISKACSYSLNKEDLINYLTEKTNLNFLTACQKFFLNLREENVDQKKNEYLKLSMNSLDQVITLLNKIITSKLRLDFRMLARATYELSDVEIPKYLRQFLKLKGCDVFSSEFTFICQKVLECRSEIFKKQVTKDAQTKVPNLGFASSEVCNKKTTFHSSTSVCQNDVALLSESHKTSSETHTGNSSDCNNIINDGSKNGVESDSPLSNSKRNLVLRKDDLEKLVQNFCNLDKEPQEAIRNYIKLLSMDDPTYADSLLNKIRKV